MLSHPTLHQIHLSQATRNLKINTALPQSGFFSQVEHSDTGNNHTNNILVSNLPISFFLL